MYAIRSYYDWAGVSPYTSSFDLAETCVFVKQLEEPFLCGLRQLHRLANQQRPPFSTMVSSSSARPGTMDRLCTVWSYNFV